MLIAGPRTLFEKVWDEHVVRPESVELPAILYVDLHLVHEVTSRQAFHLIGTRGIKLRRPDRTFATIDHLAPTLPSGIGPDLQCMSSDAAVQIGQLEENCAKHGISLAGWDSNERGIVHVMAPELGLTMPGDLVVCGDSHTSTHGAFGTLAFGIGTSEVGHVLATQCLLQRKPKLMRINVQNRLPVGISAKDLALAVTATVGFGGASGHAIEFGGSAIRALDMDERMTLCNMSVETGAKVAMIAPDAKTIEYLRGRRFCPQGDNFERAVQRWLSFVSDADAKFDTEIDIDASLLSPMATFGTTADAALPIGCPVPDPRNPSEAKALEYMGFAAGQLTTGRPVDVVFIGSCTNGRLSDLRAAAEILRGHKIKPGIRMLVVPGSETIKKQAEEDGLGEIFIEAGAEWRHAGCSMCAAMNGDIAQPGQTVVSTSNRNFAGRQGVGVRTILASPATAAASAINGVLTDPRPFIVTTGAI